MRFVILSFFSKLKKRSLIIRRMAHAVDLERPTVDDIVHLFVRGVLSENISIQCSDGVTRSLQELFSQLLQEMPHTINVGNVAIAKIVPIKGVQTVLYFETSGDCPGWICSQAYRFNRDNEISIRSLQYSLPGDRVFMMPKDIESRLAATPF